MKEFVLFWVLANGTAGNQPGFDEPSCDAARARLEAAIQATHEGRRETNPGGVYQGKLVVIEKIVKGEAWCLPLKAARGRP